MKNPSEFTFTVTFTTNQHGFIKRIGPSVKNMVFLCHTLKMASGFMRSEKLKLESQHRACFSYFYYTFPFYNGFWFSNNIVTFPKIISSVLLQLCREFWANIIAENRNQYFPESLITFNITLFPRGILKAIITVKVLRYIFVISFNSVFVSDSKTTRGDVRYSFRYLI